MRGLRQMRRRPTGRVDLRSDTVTTPDPGDAQRDGRRRGRRRRLRRGPDGQPARGAGRGAARQGSRAAHVPSGTMANQLALGVLGRPGTEILCGDAGARVPLRGGRGRRRTPACSSGRCPTTTACSRPRPSRPPRADQPHHLPPISAGHDREHAHAGERPPVAGRPRSPRSPAAAAAHGLAAALRRRAHLERGGRARRRARATSPAPPDTVMFCVSKGLGAPVGSLLCGPAGGDRRGAGASAARLGGGMRQAGMLAAGGDRGARDDGASGSPTTTPGPSGSPSRSPSGSPARVDPAAVAHQHRVRAARPAARQDRRAARDARGPRRHDRPARPSAS